MTLFMAIEIVAPGTTMLQSDDLNHVASCHTFVDDCKWHCNRFNAVDRYWFTLRRGRPTDANVNRETSFDPEAAMKNKE